MGHAGARDKSWDQSVNLISLTGHGDGCVTSSKCDGSAPALGPRDPPGNI